MIAIVRSLSKMISLAEEISMSRDVHSYSCHTINRSLRSSSSRRFFSSMLMDAAPPDRNEQLQGSVLVLIQFDVCEEIRLDHLRDVFSAQTVQKPPLKHALPSYVRYQRPPVVETAETLVLETGERLQGQIKYYDYGVVSVIFELPFSGDWEKLVQLSSRWVWDVDFSAYALGIAKKRLEQARDALVKPYKEWLNEDYFIFHVREISGLSNAADLLAYRGKQ